MEPLEALAKVLESPKDSVALRAAIAANPCRIWLDQKHHDLAVRVDDRVGLKEYGRLDDQGNFHPMSESEWLAEKAKLSA